MAGKMKVAGPFLGKDRKPGDIINDDELGHCTRQTLDALVSNGIMEIEGMGAPAGVDAATKELIGQMLGSFDRFREGYAKDMAALHDKLDVALGGKPAAKKRK
jgi:hypothetical protein